MLVTNTTTSSLLNNDISKTLLLISIFLISRVLIMRYLREKGRGLPVCVECEADWTYQEALKQSMSNGKMTCPYCSQKQYRTKKSSLLNGIVMFPIPFFVLVPQIFDHILIGVIVYILCLVLFMLSLCPYLIELQKKDPFNDPLW